MNDSVEKTDVSRSSDVPSLESVIFGKRIAPHVAIKRRVSLDEWARQFLGHTRLMILGTADNDGAISVSPRGGDAGFVKVVGNETLCFDDLPGNNLMETHRNIMANDRISLLCVIPGREETLRVRGRATLLYEARPSPATGIVVRVTVEHWYYHCGRSFRLAEAWKDDVITTNQSIGFAKRPPSKGENE